MVTRVRKTKSEERILTAAAELFYANGLRGVGIDQVIAASGVAKSTLYAHFRTKEELVATYLRRTDDSWMAQLQDAAARTGGGPREQLVGLFDALTDAFDRHGFFGCPFVSAAVEADLDSEARAVTVRHTRRRQSWLTELGERAGAAEPDALARQIGLLIDGALASGRLLQDRAVVEEAKSAARRLVADRT
ncbi:TetR/AcrR family transcriptional regulator [Streptomyces pluripotens]|uniref:TetR/AcrR family transcriptional regulator n=1 Tax=Streptomyces pluripotens TaxID=1355015 RepID=A0A221NTI6_9ACTN|nr:MULTISPECIES: TetR/AcrR family transcriptional regulator [Streptomyces]ARP68893.1 TetR family transcriptional regulator [Streptomyces pluripotens]ASN23146.1 TetR/AcrR family transcriptional regulator [Streptomyces pluripotens]MCH0556877.1 TetR/AcrR family transcriptional regulator [Streptomyces sp. MUM 16J]